MYVHVVRVMCVIKGLSIYIKKKRKKKQPNKKKERKEQRDDETKETCKHR